MELYADDVEAIRRLKCGDIGGLEILVARYQTTAIETAFLITQDEPLAEDVVQDVFIKIYRRIQNFDEKRLFGPYLIRGVINAALDALEKRSRWVPYKDGEEAGRLEAWISQAACVEDQVEFSQMKQKIEIALANLPPRQRVVIVQRYYLEMSEKEMAEALAAAPGTIKWLLNAARTRLRILLSSERSAE
jgi:RNA polymerase sigma-70 factor (ECF subfamily)